MIKYIIESLPSNAPYQKTSPKNSSSSNTVKRKGNLVNTRLHSTPPARNSNLQWKNMNSAPTKKVPPSKKTNAKTSNINNLTNSNPNSTLELLQFSHRIQEFLTKEHYLRTL